MSKDGFLNLDALQPGYAKDTRLNLGDFDYDKYKFESEHLLETVTDYEFSDGRRYSGQI